jgi:hypothetical protein
VIKEVTTTAAVEWKITIKGTDAFGEVRRPEIRIDKSWDRLSDGEIGLSVDVGKKHGGPSNRGREPGSRRVHALSSDLSELRRASAGQGLHDFARLSCPAINHIDPACRTCDCCC